MSRVFIHGIGAVSPAGWGVAAMREALAAGAPVPMVGLERPCHAVPLSVRRVPAPEARPAFMAHPRLRRTSPITHFAVAAAIEAVGEDAARVASGAMRLGIVFCAFGGCVGYSRRFYSEVLREPATASPLVFPETVFNAPASHLAAYFGTMAVNYTVVGDQGEMVKALALAADWLLADRVDSCLVVAAEEADWLTGDALRLFGGGAPLAEGAGAVCLRREPSSVELVAVTGPELLLSGRGRGPSARRMSAALGAVGEPGDLLVDGLAGGRADVAEAAAWEGWSGRRVSPRRILGEGLGASGAWQVVAAAEAIRRGAARRAVVSVVGSNEQAVGAELRAG